LYYMLSRHSIQDIKSTNEEKKILKVEKRKLDSTDT